MISHGRRSRTAALTQTFQQESPRRSVLDRAPSGFRSPPGPFALFPLGSARWSHAAIGEPVDLPASERRSVPPSLRRHRLGTGRPSSSGVRTSLLGDLSSRKIKPDRAGIGLFSHYGGGQ